MPPRGRLDLHRSSLREAQRCPSSRRELGHEYGACWRISYTSAQWREARRRCCGDLPAPERRTDRLVPAQVANGANGIAIGASAPGIPAAAGGVLIIGNSATRQLGTRHSALGTRCSSASAKAAAATASATGGRREDAIEGVPRSSGGRRPTGLDAALLQRWCVRRRVPEDARQQVCVERDLAVDSFVSRPPGRCTPPPRLGSAIHLGA